MNEECLICKKPLEYLTSDVLMECSLCHKKERSKTRCINGHFVCSDCHTRGMDVIFEICLASSSTDPVKIIRRMMTQPFCHMHGPEHHVMVGSALLTAYKNAGGKLDLPSALREMQNRGRQVPGGSCGFWGACGAGISVGMAVSILSESTPLKVKPWGLSNRATAAALEQIGLHGGPRCCKRDSYLAIESGIAFINRSFNTDMKTDNIRCIHSAQNNQCIGKLCPFFPIPGKTPDLQ